MGPTCHAQAVVCVNSSLLRNAPALMNVELAILTPQLPDQPFACTHTASHLAEGRRTDDEVIATLQRGRAVQPGVTGKVGLEACATRCPAGIPKALSCTTAFLRVCKTATRSLWPPSNRAALRGQTTMCYSQRALQVVARTQHNVVGLRHSCSAGS